MFTRTRVIKRKITLLVVIIILLCSIIYYLEDIKLSLRMNQTITKPETIHLVAVSCGRPNYQGFRDISKPLDLTTTMIKSAALFARSPLYVHIFTEEDMFPMFHAEFQSWPSWIRKRMTYTLYEADYELYLPKNLIETWKKWYKPCGSFRLLVPMILKHVTDAAIYSDSDVIFIKPIDQLWKEMHAMEKRHVAAISPTAGHPLGGTELNVNFISHPTGLFQINSGIILMNFTRMLNADWLLTYDETTVDRSKVETLKYGVDLLLNYYGKYKEVAEHDQKLLNIIFHFNPGMLQKLSCSWNFKNNFCQDDDNVCADAENSGGAGAVHGISSAFFGDVNPTFKALYDVFLKFDFEEDLSENLLQKFIDDVTNMAAGTFCATKSDVISKPLMRSIQEFTP